MTRCEVLEHGIAIHAIGEPGSFILKRYFSPPHYHFLNAKVCLEISVFIDGEELNVESVYISFAGLCFVLPCEMISGAGREKCDLVPKLDSQVGQMLQECFSAAHGCTRWYAR